MSCARRRSRGASRWTCDTIPTLLERPEMPLASNRLGLGLAIVRHLVELHGGTIRAESAGANRGSSFKVRLPLTAVQHARIPMAEGSSAAPPRLVVPSLKGLRVLLVDDEEDARVLLAEVLSGHGAKVTTMASAAHALREVLAQLARHPGE